MTRDTRTFAIVLVCFFLSGLAALLYQTVWMRYFSILFGTSELAVVTVLMAYMGGLATGAAIIGRFVERLRRPVLVYALLELGIALSAALVPTCLRLVRSFYVALLGGLEDLPPSMGLGQGLFYLSAGFLILMIPTGFMGATLPLLAKGVIKTQEEVGKRVGILYAINTLGAIFGTLAAAFLLVPALGLRLTATTGIATNIVAGLLGLTVARAMRPSTPTPDPRPSTPDPRPSTPDARPSSPARFHLILPLMLISGALAFSYEVLWTRLLGMVVGGSMTAFATMLASFLLGITLGSAIASRLARNATISARGMAVAQLGAGLLSVLVFFLLARIPEWSISIRTAGWPASTWTACASILVLLPSTLCIGATFPFAVRIVSPGPQDAGRAAARVYSWNTFGAIAGAFVAGFFLIPALGFSGMLRVAATGNLLLALVALGLVERRAPVLIGGAMLALGFGIFFRPGIPTEILRASRFATNQSAEKNARLLYHGVGRSATVVATESQGRYDLRTNGLPEAFVRLKGSLVQPTDESYWMAILPCLANLSAESMLVVGLGGGQVLNAIPPQIKTVDVVELEDEVVTANRKMAPGRAMDPLTDPRIRVIINDARNALALTKKRYDVVVSQPSHPWTAGASHLYTREFLQEVRDHLETDGVFLQWMGTRFVSPELARSLVATVRDVFPSVRVYQVGNNLIILGCNGKMNSFRDLLDAAGKDGSIAARTNWTAIRSPEDAGAALLLDEKSVARFTAGAPASTDDRNLMATRSPKLIDRWDLSLASEEPDFWKNYDAYLHGDVLTELDGDPRWNNAHLLWRITLFSNQERFSYLLDSLPPSEAAMARALKAIMSEDFSTCLAELSKVLEKDPQHRDARFYAAYALFRSIPFDGKRPELFADLSTIENLSPREKEFRILTDSMSAHERLIFETIYNGATNQWEKVRLANARLEEAITPGSILFGLVSLTQARAWMTEGADPSWTAAQRADGAKKALRLIEGALVSGFLNDTLLEKRGEAAAIAGDVAAFVDTIWYCLRSAGDTKNSPARENKRKLVARLIEKHIPKQEELRPPRIQQLIEDLAAEESVEPAP